MDECKSFVRRHIENDNILVDEYTGPGKSNLGEYTLNDFENYRSINLANSGARMSNNLASFIEYIPKIENLIPKTLKSMPKSPKTPKTKNRFPKDQNSIFGPLKNDVLKDDRKGPKIDS